MFANKNVLITGAGRGFGRTCAIQLAKLGANVFLSARDLIAVEKVKQELSEHASGRVSVFCCDITSAESIAQFKNEVSKVTDNIDILINNGAMWLEGEDLLAVTDEEIEATMTSGGVGSVLITKNFLPLLKKSGKADIINVVSICGEVGSSVSSAHAAFYASKHAHAGFAEIMSKRLRKDNVRVISLFPPDFNNLDPLSDEWDGVGDDQDVLNSSSLWNCVEFALSQPRDCYIKKIEFEPFIAG